MNTVHKYEFGCGLRPHHYSEWKTQKHLPPFLEVLIDNYIFQSGGPGLAHLRQLAERTSFLFHGVGMDLCGIDPISKEYCAAIKVLMKEFRPRTVSDHLCFTRAGGHQSYDLLPIPYNQKMLSRVTERVNTVQTLLGQPIAVENLSSYVAFVDSEMSEYEFLNELCARTGCKILCDVNNLFVNSQNFDFCPYTQLQNLNSLHVAQFHVAGHSIQQDFLHDTHDNPVCLEVWQLLSSALDRFGVHPIILERDEESVSLDEILMEMKGALRWLEARSVSSETAMSEFKEAHNELAN